MLFLSFPWILLALCARFSACFAMAYDVCRLTHHMLSSFLAPFHSFPYHLADMSRLVKRCRVAAADDPAARHFIDVLNASAEYEVFVKLMRLMRPRAAQRLMRTAEEKQEGWNRASSKGHAEEYEDWDDDKTYRSSDSFRAECKLEEIREAEAKGQGSAKR